MTGEEGTKVGSILNPPSSSSDGDVVVVKHGEKPNGQSLSEIETDLSKTSGSGSNSSINIKDKNSNNIPDREFADSSSPGLECGILGDGLKTRNGRSSSVDARKPETDIRALSLDEVTALPKDRLVDAYRELARYMETLQKDNAQMKETEGILRTQQLEASRRENVLVMRLTTKENEMQDYIAQLNELKQSIAPTPASLRNTLIDPAVNLVIQRMKKELDETKKKLEDTQKDLNAWKFTPDSNTGKRLMAKCRMLYQENEDLGKMITSGKLAKLESDLALQRSLTEEMKKSQSELDELIQELDEDVEGMQGTIYYLQQELRNSKSGSNTEVNNASTSNFVQSLADNDEDNFQNEVVSLTVKITDLCAQCQVTHQKNQSSSLLSLKMEVDDGRTKVVDNENQRTCVNGENIHPITTSSSNSDRTTRISVANAKHVDSELTDPNLNISDSEIRVGNIETRTKGDDDYVSDPETPPPTKRTKLSNHQLSNDSPIATNNEMSMNSANQNGSIEH